MAHELLMEWRRLGSVVALALFDPVHLEEVVVTGPAHMARHELERLARAKLAWRLARRRGRAPSWDDHGDTPVPGDRRRVGQGHGRRRARAADLLA